MTEQDKADLKAFRELAAQLGEGETQCILAMVQQGVKA